MTRYMRHKSLLYDEARHLTACSDALAYGDAAYSDYAAASTRGGLRLQARVRLRTLLPAYSASGEMLLPKATILFDSNHGPCVKFEGVGGRGLCGGRCPMLPTRRPTMCRVLVNRSGGSVPTAITPLIASSHDGIGNLLFRGEEGEYCYLIARS